MRIINRLGQTVLIDEYQPSRFEWQVLDSEGEPLNVGDSPSAQVAEECAVQAIIESTNGLAQDIDDCIHALHGRVVNGADIDDAVSWCREELNSAYKGRPVHRDED